jgi:hypothetical protein
MAGKSNYLENALCNWIRGTAMPSAPATVYLSLHTADPGETGASEHGATASYARTAVTFGAPSNGVMTNSAQVQFPTASANYSAAITHFGVHDAASAGNFLGGGALGSSATITTGVTPQWNVGALTWNED